MSNTLKLRLLGGFELLQNEVPIGEIKTQKTLALLSYLATTGQPHSRSALAGLLWGGMPEAKARGNLSRALSTLRPVVGAYLATTRHRVAFEPNEHIWIDVIAFVEAIQDHSPERLEAAMQWYRGDFLADFVVRNAPEFENWVLSQQARLKGLALQALHTLAVHFAEGDAADIPKAIGYTKHLLRLEPWREEAHRQLMPLLAQQGKRNEALAQYERCQQVLDEELGVEPDQETVALYNQLRDGAFNFAKNTDLLLASPLPNSVASAKYDLLEMPDIELLFGREAELSQLQQWVVVDRCRLAVLLGMGGIGKTSLAAKFVASLVKQADNSSAANQPFTKILWLSLLNAPPLSDILPPIIQFLSDQQISRLPDRLDEQLRILLKLLQEQRCLLILDNAESIMQIGQQAGTYRDGYEGYGQLIQQVAQSHHQSCLLLTSREKPRELVRLTGQTRLVQSLQLPGLGDKAAHHILAEQGLVSDAAQIMTLIERYSGHPLALKLIAETIEELYFGDIEAFLAEDTVIFADISEVLDQHFARLSLLETEILTWLAIEREPISIQNLRDNLLGPMSQPAYLEALRSLQHRALLENQGDGFTLQNVIMEYTTDRYINQVLQALANDNLAYFNRHALLKAQAKDYVRESQRRLLLRPIADNLLTHFGREGLEQRLNAYLNLLRSKRPRGYAGGNILNLLLHLGSNLHGYNFSGLTVWQAYLGGLQASDVNLAEADLAGAMFTDTFGTIATVVFSPNGKLLAAGTTDGQIRLWQATDGQPLLTLAGHTNRVWSIDFSPDGQILASGSADQTVRLWDVANPRALDTGQCLKTSSGYTNQVWSVAFSPDGQILASGSADQTVRLWNVADPKGSDASQNLRTLSGHTSGVESVAFSPDGQILASGSADETVRLWDVANRRGLDHGQCLKTLSGHTNNVWSIAFSPDGQILASGSADQMVRLWDIHSGQSLKILSGHTDNVWSVAFSSDGQILASGSADQIVRLWDIHSGQSLKTLSGHTNRVWSVAFSPDGQILASSSADRTVRLWDVHSGRSLKTLADLTHPVWSMAFSPDGKTLVSTSFDQTVRLWDVANPRGLDHGQCLKTLSGHTDGVLSVAFSPDGRIIATSSLDGTIKFWDVQTGECLETLRPDRPYERMNITGATGITEAQKATLVALGAIVSDGK